MTPPQQQGTLELQHEPAPKALPISLLLLRVGIATVMLFWTADKILNPDHARGVFSNFYGLSGLGDAALVAMGIIQAVLVISFLAGAFKTISYGAVLLMHTVSTLSSWRQYLEPFDNLLFFAAWPMLAACVALFLMRDYDRLLAFEDKKRSSTNSA